MANIERRLRKLENEGINMEKVRDLFFTYAECKNPKRRETLYKAYLAADPQREWEKTGEIIEQRIAIAKKKYKENDQLIADSGW
ncbi:MAG TPA: hypothetical protein PK475_07115 [Rectinema sp.]|nr:hypothetical protein [Rectinema sp.]